MSSAYGNAAFAFGRFSKADTSCMACGDYAEAKGKHAIAIGPYEKVEGENVASIFGKRVDLDIDEYPWADFIMGIREAFEDTRRALLEGKAGA